MINSKIIVCVGIVVVLVVLFVVIPLVPDKWIFPTEVINTFEACNWCKNNCSHYYERCPICVDGGTCCACVDYYRSHFNLTQEAFPCYCWLSNESLPTKLEWLFKNIKVF